MLKAILAGLAVLGSGGQLAQAPPPLAAYGKLPAIQDVTLAPDGQALALV